MWVSGDGSFVSPTHKIENRIASLMLRSLEFISMTGISITSVPSTEDTSLCPNTYEK
jgi:hypothetical protein